MQSNTIFTPQLLKTLINFRRNIHSNPEIGFKQYQTRKKIKNILLSFGINQSQFTQINPTGLIVNISGKALPQGQNRCIAFRADLDALTMQELNDSISYRSKNKGAAHMCGHDGHMTCLVAFVPLFLKQIEKIPSNKVIRLIFQPSQQGPDSGAKLMIEQGCLEGVDEIYGFHNWPTEKIGQIWCKQGPVMSQSTKMKLIIKGIGGHGSEPEKCKDSLYAGIKFYKKAIEFLDPLKQQKNGKFVFSIPVFQAGQLSNVISDTCIIQGNIRSFQENLSQKIQIKLKQILKQIQQQGFQIHFKYWKFAPININTKAQAQNILRVGKEVFGQNYANQGKLPFRASQDFAYYTKHKPGAFFFLSSGVDQNSPFLHCSNFDFNDELISKAAFFWYKLALDRIHNNSKN